MPLKPRDLIIDNWDRESIVSERATRPSAKWLARQSDKRVDPLPPETVYWTVLPIRGGAVLVPEPLAQFVREATVEDAMRAAEHANEAALRAIARLFPDALEQALQRRQKGNDVG